MLIDSLVFVAPRDDHAPDFFMAEIMKPRSQRRKFCAIKQAINSRMTMKDQDVNPWDLSIAQVKVVNDYSKLGQKYYGAVLESRSMISGADNIDFTTKNAKGEYEDLPKR